MQKGIDTDKKLFDILVEIQNTEDNVKKQAKLAFYKISKMYNLPIFPEDNEEGKFLSSVYEQLGFF